MTITNHLLKVLGLVVKYLPFFLSFFTNANNIETLTSSILSNYLVASVCLFNNFWYVKYVVSIFFFINCVVAAVIF